MGPLPMINHAQSRRSPMPYVALVFITLLALWPTVKGDFTTWDDADTIARNRDLNPAVTAESFVHFWTRPQGDLYVPVTYTTWAALAPLARQSRPDTSGITLAPAVYHGFNLVVHIGSVLLAYRLLRHLTGKQWASAVGAAVFAVHPVQVETVAWASGTKDLLAGFFSLAALSVYVAGVDTRDASKPSNPSKVGVVSLGTAFFLLALLSKPSCVAMPLAAVAIGRFLLKQTWRDSVIPVVPWLLLAGPAVMVGRWAQPAHVVPFVPPLWQRPIVAMDSIGFYLKQLILPIHLGLDYGRTPRMVLGTGLTAYTVLAAVLAAAVWAGRRSGMVVAAFAIFAAAVLPVLGLIPFDFQQYSTTSDHYLYLAMLGPALLFAWALPAIESARWFIRRPASIVAILVVLALGVRSFAQTLYWSNTATLFAHALEVNPNSPAARVNLAIALTDQGRLAEAAEHYRALLAVDPSNPKAHLGLGQVLARANQPEPALTHLRQAAELQPENPLTHYNLGLLLSSLGRDDEAIAAYRRALEAEPDFPEAHTNLATALLIRGDLDGAEKHYREALRIRPDLSVPKRGLEAVKEARAK